MVVERTNSPMQVRVLRDDRLLQEQRPVRLQQRRDPAGVGQGEPPVEVDGDVPVVAEDLAGGGHPGDHPVQLGD